MIYIASSLWSQCGSVVKKQSTTNSSDESAAPRDPAEIVYVGQQLVELFFPISLVLSTHISISIGIRIGSEIPTMERFGAIVPYFRKLVSPPTLFLCFPNPNAKNH